MSESSQTRAERSAPEGGDPTIEARRAVMALCGEATVDELDLAISSLGAPGTVEDLRMPEIGLVMARGRIGGDGRPFNVGEVTVTRAAIRLDGGETGFAYHLGRDRVRARLAAILDALWQREPDRVENALQAVATRRAAEAREAARKTAATRVNFFTLVRGED